MRAHTGPLKAEIQKILRQFIQSQARYPLDSVVFEYLSEYCVTGKLFRGSLFLSFFDSLSEKNEVPYSELLVIAAALEIYGSGILIQDDVMDQDLQRRGKQTVHVWLEEYAKSNGIREPRRWSEGSAICFADTLFFVAGRAMATLQLQEKTVLNLIAYSQRELALLGMAQAEDLRQAHAPSFPAQDEIIAMFLGKTGRYTARWPLALATLLAGGSEELLKKIEKIGEDIGVLYQMRDDYLGLYGDPQVTGKNATGDIFEGKKTLYAELFFATAPEDVRTRAHTIFGNKNASTSDCTWFISAIEHYGVKESIQKQLEKRLTVVLEELNSDELPSRARQLLRELTYYVIERNK